MGSLPHRWERSGAEAKESFYVEKKHTIFFYQFSYSHSSFFFVPMRGVYCLVKTKSVSSPHPYDIVSCLALPPLLVVCTSLPALEEAANFANCVAHTSPSGYSIKIYLNFFPLIFFPPSGGEKGGGREGNGSLTPTFSRLSLDSSSSSPPPPTPIKILPGKGGGGK